MGKSGALSTSNQYVKYNIEIIQNSQSIANNTSNVTVKVRFYRTNTGYETYGTGTVYCKINGTQYSASVTPSQKITNSGIVLFSKTLNISHGTDGKKTLTCSAWIDINAPLTSSEQSYSQALTTIPRYAKITTFTVSKVDETNLKVTWGCDAACDKVYYSLNSGSWVEATGYPSFNIAGLKANTTYSVKIRVRRKDSQLTTDSSAVSQTTYNYPHCNSASNFDVGQTLKLGFYNPLGRTFTVWLVLADGTERGGDKVSGTSLSGYNNSSWLNYLYGSIPNAKSGAYKVKVVYGSSTITYDKGYKYTIVGDKGPTINGLTYKDVDSKTVSVTGNNQLIVQNQSSLQISYSAATPNYSAGKISKYTFSLAGVTKESTSAGGTVSFGKIDVSGDLTLTLTVTDSRGFSTSKTYGIDVIPYVTPTAEIELKRLNNYEDETYLTVDASIASVEGKNTVTVQYRYGLHPQGYGSFVTIQNNATKTLYLNKQEAFYFNIKVTDAFGSVFDVEQVLQKGVFPLFIDTVKNAVGINDFPATDEALRVAGGVANFVDGVEIEGQYVWDFVVDRGVDGGWMYRKWRSGLVELDCVVEQISAVANELVEISVDLPFAVSSIRPFVSCLQGGWALSKPPYFNLIGDTQDKVTEMKLYYTAANATSRAYYFAVQVKGYWL